MRAERVMRWWGRGRRLELWAVGALLAASAGCRDSEALTMALPGDSDCAGDCDAACPDCDETGGGDLDLLCPYGCEDHNGCTIDSCVNGSCQHTQISSGATGCAGDWAIERCNSGASEVLTCAGLCEGADVNATAGCNPFGPNQWKCDCSDIWSMTCTSSNIGMEVCIEGSGADGDYLTVCRDADYFGTERPIWQMYNCSRMCAEAGYALSGGCAVDVNNVNQRVCLCGRGCDPACASGYRCNATTGLCEPDIGCTSDYECGYHEACLGGDCEDVECTMDSHCPYCYRCQNHACYYCGGESSCPC